VIPLRQMLTQNMRRKRDQLDELSFCFGERCPCRKAIRYFLRLSGVIAPGLLEIGFKIHIGSEDRFPLDICPLEMQSAAQSFDTKNPTKARAEAHFRVIYSCVRRDLADFGAARCLLNLYLITRDEEIMSRVQVLAKAEQAFTTEQRKTARPETKERRMRTRTAPGFGSRRGQKLSMGLTKAELIEKYRHKVRIVAVKMARDLPASVDVDDLVSMGFLGLMDAADRFDPKKGVQFSTFAEFRIRGAMLDGLREQDWVPRSARDRMDAVQAAKSAVRSRTGQAPSDSEMSEQMQMPLGKFREMMVNLGSQTLVNFEDLPEGIEPEDSISPDPFRAAVRKEARVVVENMLKDLPEQERMVLNFYYFRGLNLKEIGEIMNVSESRVSQIHSRAVLELKSKIRTQVPAVESVFLALMDE
jgi:RNA polymerase sigma factor for flagellar operon FliA